jgi:hypothetical protein
MTQAEWQSCRDPELMVRSLAAEKHLRELRLFAVACVRRIWRLLSDAGRAAVDASERFANSRASEQELRQAVAAASADATATFPGHSAPDARAYAASAAVDASSIWPRTASNVLAATSCAASAAACAAAEAGSEASYDAMYETCRQAELAAQCELLRQIMGRTS